MVGERIFDELITNRTADSFYNASDLNRVGAAVNYLAKEMSLIGYPIAERLPINWTKDDIYYDTDGDFYIGVLEKIKGQLACPSVGDFPSTLDGLDYNGANEIERFLLRSRAVLAEVKKAWPQCGAEQAGGMLI